MLVVRHIDGPLAGQEQRFGPDVERVVFGRDPDVCQVVYPPDCSPVGRRHFALLRELSGDYAIDPFGDHYVALDGVAAEQGQQLPRNASLRLGSEAGPSLRTEVEATATAEGGLQVTAQQQRVDPLRSQIRRGWRAGLVAMLVVAVLAGAAGFWSWREGQRRNALQAEFAREIEAMQARERAEAGERISGADRQRLARAVFAVVHREASGRERLLGTAWPVAGRWLATNAHVAEEMFTLKDGESLVARPPGSAEATYAIIDAASHPGYQAFSDFLNRDPFYVASASGQPRLSVIPGYDVALLQLDRPVPPELVLQVASDAELAALAPGAALAYAGYPYERVRGSDLQPIGRTPQLQTGAVTALTDNFLLPAEPAQRRLIHHSLPTTGGASGSPIIDAQGRVVALLSAGNVTMMASGRIPSAVLINYAQRADLLRDLIEGRAAARLAADRPYWEQRSAAFKRGMDLVIPALLDDARPSSKARPVIAWEQRDQSVAPTDRLTRVVNGSGVPIRSRSYSLALKAGSEHLLVLYADGGALVTSLTVLIDDKPVRRGLGGGDQWAVVRFKAPAVDKTATLVVDMPDQDARFLVRDYVWDDSAS